MNFESISPFLLITAPFAIAFLLEALVIYFFHLTRFWPAAVVSLLMNLISLGVLYGSSLLLAGLGYLFNGLQLPLQVVLFFWWISVIADALLLQLLAKKKNKVNIYLCSIVMNSVSYLFLSFFITNSH